MINLPPGAYIYCSDYDFPTIAAHKAIYYATKSPSNDSELPNNVISMLSFVKKSDEMDK